MAVWYHRIVAEPDNLDIVIDACQWFEKEIAKAVGELVMTDRRLTEIQMTIPSLKAYRFNQLQELEAILDLMQQREEAMIQKWSRHYFEHYQRQLTATLAERYAKAEPEVQAYAETRLKVAYARNLYLGHMQGLNSMDFRIGDLVKIHQAGLDELVLR